MTKLEPITGRTLHELTHLIEIYAKSGFRLTAKRVHGMWVLTPLL